MYLTAIRRHLIPAAIVTLAACGAPGALAQSPPGNPITGEGIPNPNPDITANWGELPAGREWGSTAGIDIDPTDGHIWAYERCGASSFGGGVPVNCDNNPVDPVFKFDRHTGEVLANFGAGIMVTPHGIHVDDSGNVWVTDFVANAEGTKGHQVHKFSPDGELLMSLGTAGQAGSGPDHFNQPNDVITAPDGSIFVSDGHSGQNMITNQAMEEGRGSGANGPHHQVRGRRHVHQGVGQNRCSSWRIPHTTCHGNRFQRSAVGRRSRQP